MTGARKRLLTGVAALGLSASLLMLFHNRTTDLRLVGGSAISVKLPSFFGSFCDSQCSITFTSKQGDVGTVDLYSGFFENPIMMIVPTNDNVLLCLYNFDVDIRLLKIDTGKAVQSLSLTNELGAIVCASPWNVEPGTDSDWETVIACLEQTQAKVFTTQPVSVLYLEYIPLSVKRQPLLRRIRHQMQVLSDSKGLRRID
jgi:hypothetical protein